MAGAKMVRMLDSDEEEDGMSDASDNNPELTMGELQTALAAAENRAHAAETRVRELQHQLDAVVSDHTCISGLRAVVLEHDRRALQDFVRERILDGRIPGGSGDTEHERLMAAGFFDTVYMSDVDGSQGWGEDPDHGFTMWRDVEGCVHAAWDGELVTSANPPRPPSRTPEECLEHFVMTRILGEGYDRRLDSTEEQRLMDAGWYRDLEDPLGWCDGDRGVLVWREADGFAYMH